MTPQDYLKEYPYKTLHDYYVYLENKRKANLGKTVSSNLYDKHSSNRRQNPRVKSSQLKRKLLLLVIIVIPFFSLFNGWFLLLFVPIVLSGFFNACPKCSTWFVRKRLSKEEIDRFNYREDITRSDKIKDNIGNIVGTIERKEQVTRTSVTYLSTYCCQQCGFVWNSKSKEKH